LSNRAKALCRPSSKKAKQAEGIFENVASSQASETDLLKHQANLTHQSQILALKLKDRELQRKHELAKATIEVKRLKLLSRLPSLPRNSAGVEGVSWMTHASPLASETSSQFSNSPLSPPQPLPFEMEQHAETSASLNANSFSYMQDFDMNQLSNYST